MATKIIMPQMGESVDEATVTKWLVAEGDAVKEFDPVLEVTTDKVDTEITAPTDGVMLKLLVAEGVTVRAGAVLGWIGQRGESIVAEAAPRTEPVAAPTTATPPGAAASAVAAAPPVSAGRSRELGFISPVVARMAAEHNLDLAQITGTGSGGRITKKDVLNFLQTREVAPREPTPVPTPAPAAQPAAPPIAQPSTSQVGPTPEPAPATAVAAPGQTIGLSSMRRAIAEHMVRSKQTSPHVTTVFEADLTKVVAHRAANKASFARDGVNLTFTAYFVAASVAALKAYPLVNSSFTEDAVLLKRDINIGVAVSLGEEGLIVPVLKQADRKSLLGLARELNDLAERARNRQLKPDDVQGGTFTITNHGVSGSLFATPIINQPQCAIMGVGMIQKRVVVIDDAIAIRPMVYLSLTFDHRIIDGAIADYFLAQVQETLHSWA